MYGPEELKYVNLIEPEAGSSVSNATVYVNMANYDHVDFVMLFGSCSSIASDVVTLKQAKDTSGTSSSSLAVNGYYHNRSALGSASTGNDELTWVDQSSMSSSGTKFKLAGNSTDNQVYVIPIDAADLSANSSMDAAGIDVAQVAKCGMAVMAVLSNSRYKQATPPSAV